MIYLMGASHILAIMDACATAEQALLGRGFGREEAPDFREWKVGEGTLPDRLKVCSIYMANTLPFWGTTLVEMQSGGVFGIVPGFRALLKTANDDASCTTLFVSPRGEEYYQIALNGIADPYDFLLPERPDLPIIPGRAIIPQDIIEELMMIEVSRTALILQAARIFCPRLRIVRITPPPPASSEDVLRWSEDRQLAPHRAHQLPTSVRLKLWLLYTRMMQKSSEILGLESLSVPTGTTHELGTLKYDYMGDPIHGNTAYGALVCRQITELISPAVEGS